MKKQFLLFGIAVALFTSSFSQSVSINNDGSQPDPSAMLDINSPVKGLLIPRVALTGTDDVATIPVPVESLLIYNTATTVGESTVTPGFYFWDGLEWRQLSTGVSGLKKDNADSTNLITGYTTLYQNSLKENQLVFTDGLTRTGNAINNNLSVGVSGGQTIVGSTSPNSGITYIATSGASSGITGADHVFKVGDNGSVEAMRIVSDSLGYIGIGTSSPTTVLHIKKNLPAPGHNTVLKIENAYGAGNFGFDNYGGYWKNSTANAGYGGGFNIYNLAKIGNLGLDNSGRVGIGTVTQTAYLEIRSGTTSTAPLKLTSGSLTSTPQVGAIEFSIDKYYATINGAVRKTLAFLESPTFTGTVGGITQAMVGLANVNNTSDLNKPVSTLTQAALDSKWGTTGNSGTDPANNFIGTTDNVPFNVRANNEKAGSIDFTLLNSFWGYHAGNINTSGNGNTAVGFNALMSNATGNSNTALGNGADVSADGLTNVTAIGSGAIANASNTVTIGNGNVTDIYFGSGTATLHANSIITPSDARFKYNVKTNVPGLEFIKKLTPVTYYFDEEKLDEFARTGILNNGISKPAAFKQTNLLHTGFLAQDVEKVAKELGYNFDGIHAPINNKDHYSLAYTQFIMPLVKSVQEQEQIIENQDKKINSQAEQIKKMDERINNLARTVELLSKK